MRIATVFIAGLLTTIAASPAFADRHSDLKACTDAALAKAKAAGFSNKATAQASKEIDRCSEVADRAWRQENPEEFTPSSSYYEFESWKIDQDYKREVEAINRNYDLRRSGVLP